MAETRVGDDAVVDLEGFGAREPVNRRVEQDVFLPRQLGVKAGAELDHAADARAACHEQISGGRLVDAGDHFEEGALARAVAADEAYGLAVVHLERNRAQRPELLDTLTPRPVEQPKDLELELASWVVPQVKA